jgi:hypothetical protein
MIHNGEWRKIALRINGETDSNGNAKWVKAVLSYENNAAYLLSHVRRLHGAAMGTLTAGAPALHSMLGFWIAGVPEPDDLLTWEELYNFIARSVIRSGIGITDMRVQLEGPEYDATWARRSAGSGVAASRERAAGEPVGPGDIRRTRRANGSAANERAAGVSVVQASEEGFYLSNYEFRNTYTGQNGYHSSHRTGFMNQPTNGYNGYRMGIELEVEFLQNRENLPKFARIPSNWFTREHDSSLDDCGGVEIITIPLTPADAKSVEVWQPLVDWLNAHGATSWQGSRCGLHVHIGREILGTTQEERDRNEAKLVLFYSQFINEWNAAHKVYGRRECYHEQKHDGNNNREIAAANVLGPDVWKCEPVARRIAEGISQRNKSCRYYALNTTNAATVEFRKGRGSLNVKRIQAIVTFNEVIALYAVSHDMGDYSLDGFKRFIRETVPATNGLYDYLPLTGECSDN